MKWTIEHGGNHAKHGDGLLALLFVFIVVALISRNILIFIVAGIWTSYYFLNRFYEKQLVHSLILNNPKRKIRLFPGQESSLSFSIENCSFFPFLNGVLRFRHGRAINTPYSRQKELQLPVPLLGKRKAKLNVPITAEQRGTARLYGISYSFSHLFLFDRSILSSRSVYLTECIVFPQLLPVVGLEAVMRNAPGEQRVRNSPFEDLHQLRGTRDYELSDPFYRINWKASAKSQSLQTNTYEKKTDLSFAFIVNVAGDRSGALNSQLEHLLSYTAFLCQQANEKGFAYEMFLNVRTQGAVPYFHLPEGEGNAHYFHALEMLAHVDRLAPLHTYESFLYLIGHQLTRPKVIIFIGGNAKDKSIQLRVTSKWKYHQHAMFMVENMGGHGVIHPFGKELQRYG